MEDQNNTTTETTSATQSRPQNDTKTNSDRRPSNRNRRPSNSGNKHAKDNSVDGNVQPVEVDGNKTEGTNQGGHRKAQPLNPPKGQKAQPLNGSKPQGQNRQGGRI